MKTTKPLVQLIPDILAHYRNYWGQMQFELKMYKLHEGQVREAVEASLKNEMLSPSAYKRAVERIPSINVVQKVSDKLSKVYAEAPIRFSEKDQELITEFTDSLSLNAYMAEANRSFNYNNRCALEIYQEEGVQKLKLLNAHQFLPFSDSITSPNQMTVFIKLLGQETQRQEAVADNMGYRDPKPDQVTMVDLFALYSDDEFMVIDSSGAVRSDLMAKMGATSTVNPFGVIPFVYINRSFTELVPFPNQTGYDLGILVPKLLTDLNFSAQFMSHSVIWTRNVQLQNPDINPDAIVDLGDTTPDGGTPDIGVIKPETDISNVLSLIEFQLSAYLSTVGIKSGAIGQLEASNASSGISKIIDEGDTTEIRKKQTELFRMIEKDFWNKLSTMQAYWSTGAIVIKKDKFNPAFIESFSIKFADIKPIESEKDKYDKMKVARELKLITKRQALKEIYPNLPEDQLDVRLEELEEELKKEKKEMMQMGLTPGATQLDRQKAGVSDANLIKKAANGTLPE